MSRRLRLSLAAVAATAGLACLVWGRSLVHAQDTAVASAGARIERLLLEIDLALTGRAAELAELPKMSAALATDPETIRDLTGSELPLVPNAGEGVTLAQRLRDGRVVVLLSLPSGHAPEVVAPGPLAEIRDGHLVLSHTVAVVPPSRAEELTGLVTVSRTADAGAIRAVLPPWSPGAQLRLGGRTMGFGSFAEDEPGLARALALPGGLEGVVVLADPTRTRRIALWGMAGVCTLLSLGLLLAGGRKRAVARVSGPGALREPTAVDAAISPSMTVTSRPQTTAIDPQAPVAGVGDSKKTTPILAPSHTSSANDKIGRYALVRKLGEGGMADVFLAKFEGEAGFGRLVALKILQPLFAAHPVAVDLFLDEARLVATLDHPNIVQTYDLGRAGDRYFIAMEYVDGTDLGRMLGALRHRNACVAVPHAIAILCRLCDGLHAAHTATGPDGVPLCLVHRDVKSANVFLARTGSIKIGDFGIAKATHAMRTSRTEVGQVKGTPDYMPPEQRLGLEVDPRTDIYGIGAVAYEMLSGRTVNLDLVALAAQGRVGWPHLPRLSSLRADVPRELEEAVFKALAYDRNDRFADCATFEQVLRTAASSCGIASDKEIGAWVRAELNRPTAG